VTYYAWISLTDSDVCLADSLPKPVGEVIRGWARYANSTSIIVRHFCLILGHVLTISLMEDGPVGYDTHRLHPNADGR
jgi:hypothetical protein